MYILYLDTCSGKYEPYMYVFNTDLVGKQIETLASTVIGFPSTGLCGRLKYNKSVTDVLGLYPTTLKSTWLLTLVSGCFRNEADTLAQTNDS